ncbi:MAG: carbon-nitrogen hydrolase family protein [Bacteroidales bacterium]|nr:carbon-nitrogen hydrolase family protein [Bacteroidales bacterium]
MKRFLTLALFLFAALPSFAAPMKARVIQPLFGQDRQALDKSFEWTLRQLEKCNASLDIVVLPEFSEVPGATPQPEDFLKIVREYGPTLLQACSETARRCSTLVFCGAIDTDWDVPRNATFVFGRDGALIGKYYKEHLTAGEWQKYGLDKSYTEQWTQPLMMDIEGVRYAFLTCYDFYFYENFANIARWKPDVIIGCSHQRSDPFRALDIINTFCAYNTGAYVVRASVSMGRRSKLGGCSCIVSPTGKILGKLRSQVRVLDVTFDPKEKYLKPAGYGNPPALHSEYIEIGRRPWKYRPGGSAIVPPLSETPAEHSYLHSNDLAALGAAVATGTREIGFDLDPSGDWEAHLQEILQHLSCHAIMDIHLAGNAWDEAALRRLYALVFVYDAVAHTHFSVPDAAVREQLSALAPKIPVSE